MGVYSVVPLRPEDWNSRLHNWPVEGEKALKLLRAMEPRPGPGALEGEGLFTCSLARGTRRDTRGRGDRPSSVRPCALKEHPTGSTRSYPTRSGVPRRACKGKARQGKASRAGSSQPHAFRCRVGLSK